MKKPWRDTLLTGRLWATALGVLLTCVALWFVWTGNRAATHGPAEVRRSTSEGFPVVTVLSDDTKLRGRPTVPSPRVAATPKADVAPIASLRGSVVDASTRSPIVGARVFLASASTDVVPAQVCVTTGANGVFILDCPPSQGKEARHVHAIAEGYLPTSTPVSMPGSVLELSLDHGVTLRGRVVDQIGKPVPGAEVYGSQPDSMDLWPASKKWIPVGAVGFHTWTSEDGSFVAQGLEEDRPYVVRARKRGYAPRPETQDAVVCPGSDQVTLELSTCARLEVEAVHPDGGPVPSIRIRAVYLNGTLPIGPIVVGSPTEKARATPERSRREWLLTAAEKSSRKDTVLSVKVTCSGPGYEPLVRTISLGATERLSETVVMERRAGVRWHRVRPMAKFDVGKPYRGALSLLVTEQGGAGEQMIVSVAFKEGQATREFELPHGLYHVVPFGAGSGGAFWKPAGAEATWNVDAATTPSETSLSLSGGCLALEVYDPRGRRVRALLVACTPRRVLGLQPVWVLPVVGEAASTDGGGAPLGTPSGMWLPAGDQTLYVRRRRGKGVSIPLLMGSQGEIIRRVVTIPD